MTIFFSEQLVPIDDQTPQNIFLLLDEVPCNIDPGFGNVFYGRTSGDWKSLETNGINLMMVLKPFENSGSRGTFYYLLDKIISRKRAIDLSFPEDIAHLKLSRIYRCTKTIAKLYEEIVTQMNKPPLIRENYGINNSSTSYNPGHEIHGDHPEVLLLPKCNCWLYCNNPVEHLLQANKTKIIAMLKRIQSKFTSLEVTVLIDSRRDDQKCVNWLKTELIKENDTIGNIVFKTIRQCRGLEFPVLLTISVNSVNTVAFGFFLFGRVFSSTALDAWTRVTASLFIIQMEDEYSAVTRGLKNCLKKQVAKQAKEQEEIQPTLLKKLYFSLQNPLLCNIFVALLVGVMIFLTYSLYVEEKMYIVISCLFLFFLVCCRLFVVILVYLIAYHS